MKADIHPTWYPEAMVSCACGAKFTTGSTLERIKIEICSKCHPYFSGQQKFVDTLGQVERFQKKEKAFVKKHEVKKVIYEAREAKKANLKTERPSLKDLLIQARKDIKSS